MFEDTGFGSIADAIANPAWSGGIQEPGAGGWGAFNEGSPQLDPGWSSGIQEPAGGWGGGAAAPEQPGFWGKAGETAGAIGGAAKTGIGGLANAANAISPLLRVGTGVMGIANSIQGQQQLAQMTRLAQQSARNQSNIGREQMATANPLQRFSGNQLDLHMKGQISPQAEARIQEWVDGQKQKAAQYFASAGQGSSSSMFQMNAWIDRMAQSMRQQELDMMANRGVNAGGIAGNVLGGGTQAYGGAGNIAVNQQQSLQRLIEMANAQMGQMGGGAR